jgi:hypothetical protein
MSVPKNLAFLIPEILARPAIAGRARTLPIPPVGKPAGQGEEDVRNAKATRSRDFVEGGSLQDGSGPFGGVSLRSVNRIAEEAPVVHVDDAVEREKRRIGRPSIVEDFRKNVVKILEEKSDLPSLEILRRVRDAGYQGGKTALYALVASVRPKEIKPLIRFEGLPGEFSQHDFGEVDVTFLDGSTRRIHFFASRLKYSRFIRVSVVKDQAVESLVRNLAEHLNSWGGLR